MKIGITCYPTYGGSGVVATELGLELAQRGHEIHFISYAQPIRLRGEEPNIHYHEVEVSRYPLFDYPPYDLALATRMAEKGEVYILDEPTTGLHLADIEQLLGLLDRLVDSGKSVIVIEHHQAVMAHADWIIDIGPGAGHDGGKIVFEGTPAEIVAARSTLTGEHLAGYVAA